MKLVARTLVLWLAGTSLGGIVAAAASGEFGSILFVGFGVALGVAGAVTHVALLFVPWFRNRSLVVQSLLLWLATLVSLVALIALALLSSTEPDAFSLREAIGTIGRYAALPSLIAATLLSWFVGRAAA